MSIVLKPKPLTQAEFAPFGEVIEKRNNADKDFSKHCFEINNGFAIRHHKLAVAELNEQYGGSVGVSIFAAKQRSLPVALLVMERHPFASQAFMPLPSPKKAEPYLVVVAKAGKPPQSADDLHVFYAKAHQGVQYATGVWHHPLLALNNPCDFLVIDRIGGEGKNCDELDISSWGVTVEYRNL